MPCLKSDLARPGHGPVGWLLRITILATAISAAWVVMRGYSPINSLLFIGWGTDESLANAIDGGLAFMMVVLAAAAFIRPHAALALPIGLWLLAWAIANMMTAGSIFGAVAVPAHATRYMAPLALFLICRGRADWIVWPLRIATASMFITHGLEALWLNPKFVDYLIGAGRTLAGWHVTEEAAHAALYLIGSLDLAVGGAILATRWRTVAAWMALWGLVTAAARIVHGGWGAWPEMFIRTAHWMVPLAVWWVWQSEARAATAQRTEPDGKLTPAISSERL